MPLPLNILQAIYQLLHNRTSVSGPEVDTLFSCKQEVLKAIQAAQTPEQVKKEDVA